MTIDAARRDRRLRDVRLVRIDRVSTPSLASAETSASTRAISSSAETAGRSPRADSPPTSTMSAPAATSARPALQPHRDAVSSPRPSENESGVALRIPISSGRAPSVQPPRARPQDHDFLMRSLVSLRVTLPALSTAATFKVNEPRL